MIIRDPYHLPSSFGIIHCIPACQMTQAVSHGHESIQHNRMAGVVDARSRDNLIVCANGVDFVAANNAYSDLEEYVSAS